MVGPVSLLARSTTVPRIEELYIYATVHIYLYLSLSFYLFPSLSAGTVHDSTPDRRVTYLFFVYLCMSINVSIYISIYLFIYPSISLSIYLPGLLTASTDGELPEAPLQRYTRTKPGGRTDGMSSSLQIVIVFIVYVV